MKYHNKHPWKRMRWQRVILSPRMIDFKEAKRWCQLQSSDKRFYARYDDTWHFEDPKDAAIFILRWS